MPTPAQSVSNSPYKDEETIPNEIMVKGANTLADIFNNLTKFHSYGVALVYDFIMDYNSIMTGLVETLQKAVVQRKPG